MFRTFLLFIAATLCCPGQTPAGMRPLPPILFGVTLDDVSNLSGLSTSLQKLPTMAISRIVFDQETEPGDYTDAIFALHPFTYIMGELLDSEYVDTYSLSQYTSRTTSFLKAFGNEVDLWEVGNELNGEWLGGKPYTQAVGRANPPVAKAYGAWQILHKAGKLTALTLYYEPPQTVTAGYDMVTWAQKNFASLKDMATGLNYVLVSYYEVDNNNIRPTAAQWKALFSQLHAIFPDAKLGFGEIGLDDPVTSHDLAQAERILSYYYELNLPVPGWVRGDFWWYFAEDGVPDTKPSWHVLSTVIKDSPW